MAFDPIPAPVYPEVVMPPDVPNCIIGIDVPLVLTPFKMRVTLFAHEGMPVKVIDVPLADTAVPATILLLTPLTATVPVPAGNVIVPLAAEDGCRTVVPEVDPFNVIPLETAGLLSVLLVSVSVDVFVTIVSVIAGNVAVNVEAVDAVVSVTDPPPDEFNVTGMLGHRPS